MAQVPEEYRGREQTYLKHRVLEEYLASWTQKLAHARAERLWYVDCLAGPWESKAADMGDTSPAIALTELNKAALGRTAEAVQVKLGAVFVEKTPTSFSALEELVASHRGEVDVRLYRGDFGDHVPAIDQLLGTDAALLFVDPTGWKDAPMRHIQRLAKGRWRDVIVNVMLGHIHRFKDAPHDYIPGQMRELFGLDEEELPKGLKEDGLMDLYRQKLKEKCGLPYTADLIIPHPTKDRTKFRLVVGGHHKAVIRLFRDVEARVAGREAEKVSEETQESRKLERTRQPTLFSTAKGKSPYRELREQAIAEVARALPRMLGGGPKTFGELWPILLQECHTTCTHLAHMLWHMKDEGEVVIEGIKPRQKTVHDDHVVRLPHERQA